jgi:hypothetical protein
MTTLHDPGSQSSPVLVLRSESCHNLIVLKRVDRQDEPQLCAYGVRSCRHLVCRE